MKDDTPISITEDMMREHGILNRILLIYEKIIELISNNKKVNYQIIYNSAYLVRIFIEDYHEKIEEKYIFPLFNNNLTKILLKQHKIGRYLTNKILNLSKNKKNLNKIKICLEKFIYMYRAHESREDTEIFTKVRNLVSEQKFDKLSEISEKYEHKYFGKNGFENILNKVIKIEKKLKINNLNYYNSLKI